MAIGQYWLDVSTWETWEAFRKDGGDLNGFPKHRWKSVQQMRPGDMILCYLKGGDHPFVAALEVAGKPFMGGRNIWDGRDYPCRVPVKAVVELTRDNAVSILTLRDRLRMFETLRNPRNWGARVRMTARVVDSEDGETVLAALRQRGRRRKEREQLEWRRKRCLAFSDVKAIAATLRRRPGRRSVGGWRSRRARRFSGGPPCGRHNPETPRESTSARQGPGAAARRNGPGP